MPAPKQFKPAPSGARSHQSSSRTVMTKGKYSTTPRATPTTDDPAVVEVSIDDLTLVVGGSSKYEHRSLHAYGEVGHVDEPSDDIEIVETLPDPDPEPTPAVEERTPLGEWRSSSSIEGTRYHRTDSRLI
jgi:hypothetical protein